MSISFIILTWNAEQDVSACLESIIRTCTSEELSYKILIVDNGSTDNTKAILSKYSASNVNIYCDFLEENKGTTISRNIALKKVETEYIFVIDIDTEIKSGSLKNTLQYLKDNPDIGLIAPKLILPDSEVQNSVKKFPTLNEKLSKTRKIFKLGHYNTSDFYSEFPFSEPRNVDTAISASWIFSKKIIDEVGLLDENIFYAPEDVDYSLRVWEAGYRVVYYPYFEVLHKTQQISHRDPFGKVARSHLKGLLYYYNKHGYWFSRKKIYKKLKMKPIQK